MKVQSYIIRTMQLSVRIVLNLLLVNRVSDLVVSLWPVRNFIFGFEQNERRAPAAHLQIDNSGIILSRTDTSITNLRR
jgi:hypothetical protein